MFRHLQYKKIILFHIKHENKSILVNDNESHAIFPVTSLDIYSS